MNVLKLGMDGLMERQKAITANIANAMSPDYQRKEVNFESQLAEIIEKDDLKQYIKGQNSIKYTPTSLEMIMMEENNLPQKSQYKTLTPQEAKFLQSNIYESYGIQLVDDTISGGSLDGNNVEIEREMMDLSKTGTQYVILSNLQRRNFAGLSDVIKGQ